MENNNNKTNISSVIWTIGFMFTLGIMLANMNNSGVVPSVWDQIWGTLVTFVFWPFLLGVWVAGK